MSRRVPAKTMARVTGRRGAFALGLAAGAAGGAVFAAVASEHGPAPAPTAPRAALAVPPRPALAIPAPRALADGAGVTRWTVVRRATVARALPRRGAAAVARVTRLTPEGTETALPVTGRRKGRDGTPWLRVTLPVLPNGTQGWVPRRALGGYAVSRHRLIVDRARMRLTLLRRGRVLMRAPVGIGQARWPTPRRQVPGPQPARGLHQRGVRAGRIRHERPLPHADGLARRRVHRHPRHRPARPDPRPRVARLRAAPQR